MHDYDEMGGEQNCARGTGSGRVGFKDGENVVQRQTLGINSVAEDEEGDYKLSDCKDNGKVTTEMMKNTFYWGMKCGIFSIYI